MNEGNEETKQTFAEKVINTGGEHFPTIIVSMFILQIGNLFTHYFFGESNFILSLVLFLCVLVSYLFFKDVAQDKYKRFGFHIARIAFFIFVASLVNHGFLAMTEAMREVDPNKASSLFRLSFFFNVGVALGLLAFFRNDSIKETMELIHERNTLEMLKLQVIKEELRKGDVQIAVNVESQKPVILKEKDRFLHMLILGPTGSGKTSQTILPMINSDMQNFETGITVLEPKGDLAEKVYAMAEHYGRKAVYFNPLLPDCPYFNPLYGDEEDVVENMATTFKMLNPDSPQFFLDMNEQLIRNALKVLKRLYGNKSTLIELNRLITNSNGMGRKMITTFSRLGAESEEMAKENADIASYFQNDYFNEKSKTYEHCSAVRSQIAKLISNKYLRRVLNPPNGENDVNFDKVLANGEVIAISTAQGKLRDLGKFLGYFIILQLQSSVFRRPGNENTRRPHWLFIDEFQVYSNPGFSDMLTQGRSYRVASHLATQNRALIGMGAGSDGKDFVELVSTNARNIIIYPGGNATDAKYYSDQFGEIVKKETQKGRTRQIFNPLKGIKPMSYDSESIRETETVEARYSPSDIIYRPFGEITYGLIRDNSIEAPGVGKIQYIPRELNDKLDAMIEVYNESIFAKEGGVVLDKDDEEQNEPNSVVPVSPVDGFKPIDAVVSRDLSKERNTRKGNTNDFVEIKTEPKRYRGNEIIDPNQEFMDDFVQTPSSKENSPTRKDNAINFTSEEEDDVL